MSTDSAREYLQYFQEFTVPIWRIKDNVHPSHRKEVTKECNDLHDEIADIIDSVKVMQSAGGGKGGKIEQHLKGYSEELGVKIATIMHYYTKYGPLRLPDDPIWRGDSKYKNIQKPIACDYVAEMLNACDIEKSDPIVKTFTLCLDNHGNFNWWNRFTSIEEFERFNQKMFDRIIG